MTDLTPGVYEELVTAELADLALDPGRDDNRAAMLGGMRATAPAEVFDGVIGLAAQVLEPRDHAALTDRLGLVPEAVA